MRTILVPEMMTRMKALELQVILCQFLLTLSPTTRIMTMRRRDPHHRLLITALFIPIMIPCMKGGLDDQIVEESMDLITEEDSRTRKTFFDIHEV